MKSLLLTSLAVTLFASSAAQAANVCNVFDGNSIGPTFAERAQATNPATNQDLYGKNDVFYGGDLPTNPGTASPNDFGAHASSVVTNATYDLTVLQSITVSGNFYNTAYGNANKNFNESYLSIFPAAAALANPVAGIPVLQREGIFVGNGNGQFRGGDNVNNTTATIGLGFGPINPANPGDILATWYDMAATFSIVGTDFVLSSLTLNGASVAGPVIIGPVANYPWLNNVRVGIAADDAASQICIDDHQAAVATTAVPTLSNISLAVLGLLLFGFAYSRKSQFTA